MENIRRVFLWEMIRMDPKIFFILKCVNTGLSMSLERDPCYLHWFLEEFFGSLNASSDMTENDKLDCIRTSSQSYQKVNDEQPQYDEVERPIPHVCSAEQGKYLRKLIKFLQFRDMI